MWVEFFQVTWLLEGGEEGCPVLTTLRRRQAPPLQAGPLTAPLLLQELQEQCPSLPKRDAVRWVLTVPAIWKQPAKQFMREAAYLVSMRGRIRRAAQGGPLLAMGLKTPGIPLLGGTEAAGSQGTASASGKCLKRDSLEAEPEMGSLGCVAGWRRVLRGRGEGGRAVAEV